MAQRPFLARWSLWLLASISLTISAGAGIGSADDLSDDDAAATQTPISVSAPAGTPAQLAPTRSVPPTVAAPTDDSAQMFRGDPDARTDAPSAPLITPRAAKLGPPFAPFALQFPSLLRGTLTPPAPFPLVIGGVAHPLTTIAPGIRTFSEHLVTALGPLVIHGILVDPRAPGVQFRTVLAHDRIVSSGETLSSMAHRTGAIAGINGDYFAIHQTNEPLGIAVSDGALLHTPSRRVALSIEDDDAAHISPFVLRGSVRWDTATVPLTGVNSWPPDGGASLILPSYGAPNARPRVKFLRLQPATSTADGQTYRILADASAAPPAASLGLALGPAALAYGQPPDVGDTILIQQTVQPAIDSLMAAIGGGPQLLAGHEPMRDTFDPLNDEGGRRFPLSGVGLLDDGELLLIAVDGRAPLRSMGLTRAEFGALFSSLGAADAMCLDSGGSTTLVAKMPGELIAQIQNHPSDNRERPIGDGLLIYSGGNSVRAYPAARVQSGDAANDDKSLDDL